MSDSSQVHTISGRGLPLVGNDIDTDRIIPARFLRAITFDGLGDQVFADDRKQLANHPFNQAQYKDAEVLLVNRNFGLRIFSGARATGDRPMGHQGFSG